MSNSHGGISKEEALEFHKRNGKPGKFAMCSTKPLVTQHDLSLAYSPGVAYPCEEIFKKPETIYEYTSKGNLVAIISNGTAVLGLGNLGAAASKPVMEGKAALFKKFADIDAIDIEVDTEDPEAFINAVRYLGKTWGGINLEDIKSPECFIIEKRLREVMDIPVFHDDQHGTAIIVAAGIINSCFITNRKLENLIIVSNGTGAAGIACIELLKKLGVKNDNVISCDSFGVIHKGRKDGMNPWKEKHAIDTDKRTLLEAMKNADVFLGLSVKGAVNKDMVEAMAPNPIIFAMANPDPEITPEEVFEVRKDAIMATGRSDYNNQVNNVMGFPYIFRGALDVRASTINDEMKIAAAYALAELARLPVPEEVSKAYFGKKLKFGPEYIIPAPFDPRLISIVPVAVAEAAIKSGVAKIKNFDLDKYKILLGGRLDITSNYMNLIFSRIQNTKKRIILAEGEEEETISAALTMRDNGCGIPVLVGRMNKIEPILAKMGVGLNIAGIEVVNAANTKHLDQYIEFLYQKLQRKGYLQRECAKLVKSDRNIFASCMLAHDHGDAMLTGLTKSYSNSLDDILKIIPPKENHIIFSYSILLTQDHNIIVSDCSVNELPTAEELADIATQTANIAKTMGYSPRVALVSFSNFGNPMKEKAFRIREAAEILTSRNVDFEFEGEMSPDVALNQNLMQLYPFCRLSAPANILVMPALNTAVIATKIFQELGGGRLIGPILTGLSKSVQIVPMGSSASEIINLAAFALANSTKI